MKDNGEKVLYLVVVIVGDDGVSLIYVGSKVKVCECVGFEFMMVWMFNIISELELLKKIDEFNNNDDIDGFII